MNFRIRNKIFPKREKGEWVSILTLSGSLSSHFQVTEGQPAKDSSDDGTNAKADLFILRRTTHSIGEWFGF